ncbi:MAG: HAD hydrolase family protein [Gemmatimonadota bacterium]
MIVFTDVDGTLLDETLEPPCTPAELRDLMGPTPIVLASSRPLVELAGIQRTLGLRDPVIAENGAVVAFDADDLRWGAGLAGTQRSADLVLQSEDRSFLVTTLGDPAGELLDSARKATRARGHDVLATRLDSIPGPVEPWNGDRAWSLLLELEDSDLDLLRRALDPAGCAVERGGRYVTVVRGSDKGRALQLVSEVLVSAGSSGPTVALGNAPNDVSLFLAADCRFAIRDDNGKIDPDLLRLSGVQIPRQSGTNGWWEVMKALHHTAPREEIAP